MNLDYWLTDKGFLDALSKSQKINNGDHDPPEKVWLMKKDGGWVLMECVYPVTIGVSLIRFKKIFGIDFYTGPGTLAGRVTSHRLELKNMYFGFLGDFNEP